MSRRISGAVAGAILIASLSVALPGAAHASVQPAAGATQVRIAEQRVETLEPTVSVRVGTRVAWVVVDLPALDARRVRMDVRTPVAVSGARRTWQWCEIDYVGPGRYRCGVDVRKRTGARSLVGAWEASAEVDALTIGVVPFVLT
ncbi:MAG TPA: hypothetical protein VHJ34_15030 [Actinomycetota bacterium]|nr:hypothetical protein [Actinomycetota bacterium]